VFVTGPGGLSPPRPSPDMGPGPTGTYSLYGTRMVPPVINGNQTGVGVGQGPEGGQGQ